MIKNNIYSCFATHDTWIIERIEKLIEKNNFPKNNCEFQALSGVPIDKTLDELLSKVTLSGITFHMDQIGTLIQYEELEKILIFGRTQ